MSPSLMDDEFHSSGSFSAEERTRNTAGSDRKAEGQQVRKRGMKRREKNRDAARKTRRKQTERADDLHQELQYLEQENTAFEKEIAALKKELQYYTKVLARHEHHCQLGTSTISSTADGRASSGLPGASPQTSSSSAASPSFPLPPLHSLFSKELPATVTPVFANLLSTPMTSSVFTTAAQPLSDQDLVHETSSVAANACFSTPVGSMDGFLMKQTSSSPSARVVPPYPNSAGDCADVVPQLHPGQCTRNLNSAGRPLCSLLPQLQDPAFHSVTISPRSDSEPSPGCDFAMKPCRSQEMTPSPASLLSLLTTPSPPNISQNISSGSRSDRRLSQPLRLLTDPSTDLSLSELLDVNDWILGGTSNQ